MHQWEAGTLGSSILPYLPEALGPPHPPRPPPFLFKYLMLGRPTPGLSSLGKEEQMEENCGGWEGLCGKSGLKWVLQEGSQRYEEGDYKQYSSHQK